MRKLSVTIDYTALEEAFRAGKTKEMLPKLLRVLSRKTGVDFYNQDSDVIFPEEYTNASGKFLGFMVFMKGGGQALRFNTLLTKSERFVSIDYFTKIANTPTYTIDIPAEFNIIDVIGHVELILTGEYFDIINENQKIGNKKKLNEKVSQKEIIELWFRQNPGSLNKASARGTDWAKLLTEYIDFLDEQGHRIKIPSKATFQVYCGQVVNSMGNDSSNIPHVNVRNGQPEEMINTDTASEQTFETEIIQNEHLAKYSYMEWLFNQIKAGNKEFNGVYLYGQGGIGKSYTAETMLKPLPNCFYFQGIIQGYTGLLQLLYDHKDNEIIVLDDTLSHKNMKNTTIQNILKLAMLPDPPNRIQVSKKAINQGVGNDEGETAGSHMDIPVSGDDDLVDFSSEAGVLGDEMDTPEDFEFNSWLVFITNYSEVPQPIMDRIEIIEFLFSNEQISDIIGRALAVCEPVSISLERKEFALDWIRQTLRRLNSNITLSFRLFRKIAYMSVTAPPEEWEEWATIKLMGKK